MNEALLDKFARWFSGKFGVEATPSFSESAVRTATNLYKVQPLEKAEPKEFPGYNFILLQKFIGNDSWKIPFIVEYRISHDGEIQDCVVFWQEGYNEKIA